MSSVDGEFDFLEWLSLTRISESGAKKLISEQVGDLETLMLLRESDIELLHMSLPDAVRFRAGINKLHVIVMPPLLGEDGQPLPKPLPVVDVKSSLDSKSSEEKIYSLKDVEKLLAGGRAVSAGGSPGASASTQPSVVSTLTALLGASSITPAPSVPQADIGSILLSMLAKSAGSSSSPATPDVRELLKDLLNLDGPLVNERGEKALLPIHFLSCVRGTQESEELIHQGKGMNLVLQTNTKRCAPEKLTVGQWTGANARILEKLITSGRLSPGQISDYLEYNRKIGDLLQLFVPSSVFLLDHNHRLEVHHDAKRRWNEIDATLQSSHLRRKDAVVADSTFNKSAPSSSNAASSQARRRRGVCYAYNSPEGCREGKDRCRYEHVESSDRYPRASGVPERAPRFQKAIQHAPGKD
jgi:hypothetical protein